MTIVKFQSGITTNSYSRLMILCISMKFHENILNGWVGGGGGGRGHFLYGAVQGCWNRYTFHTCDYMIRYQF